MVLLAIGAIPLALLECVKLVKMAKLASQRHTDQRETSLPEVQ